VQIKHVAVNVLHYNRPIFTAVDTWAAFSYIFLVSHVGSWTYTCRPQVFKNRVLRKIFGPYKEGE